MGASSYSSYSGKGSTNTGRNTSANRRSVREERSKSPNVEMLELLEEVERCRDVVATRQAAPIAKNTNCNVFLPKL